jgi:hypothetical protein
MRQHAQNPQKSGPGFIRQDTTRTATHIITKNYQGDFAMSQTTATTISPSPVLSPTQKLRDLIDASSWGGASPDELHSALLELESVLGLPLTDANAEDVAA